jgi:pimeloyl-ACP methyl ester carboxylesterase
MLWSPLARRRTSLTTAVLVACGGLLPAAPAAAAAHRDLPDSAPPAARAAEPRLPAADGWPFPERYFPRTSGTGRVHSGAAYWSDFVYDDHGPAVPGGFTQPGAADLAPTQGVYTYPDGPAHGNGADLFRTAVGVARGASYWRVDWSTLADPDVPIAAWTFDRDDDPKTGTSAWPAGAGVSSPGIDSALVVSSRGAWLGDLTQDRWWDVTKVGGSLTVDRHAGSFVVRIPTAALPVTGRWKVRVASGLADDTGRGFAEPTVAGATPAGPGMPRVYNVGYRAVRQEPPVYRDGMTDALAAAFERQAASTPPFDRVGADGQARFVTGNFWMEDHQADALAAGDVASFGHVVAWRRLRGHASTPEPSPRGYSNRWYVSGLGLGQGVVAGSEEGNDLRPNFLGRIQPYAVYVPRHVPRGRPMPLTWVLHSLGVNQNQYGALDPRLLRQLCERRGSVCATTLGYGPDGWYLDEAENDFWSVWREMAQHFRIQERRTVMSGYSMGGYAAYKLALQHPDLYAGAVSLAGPPACGSGADPDQGAPTTPSERCGSDGATGRLVGNARWLPYRIGQGTADELVPFASVEQQVQHFDDRGLRYRFVRYPAEDHMVFAVQDRFRTVVHGLGHPVAPRNPDRVSFTWFPHLDRPALGLRATGAYWVTGVRAHDRSPGTLASVAARTFARPDRGHRIVRSGPTPVSDPLPAAVSALAWREQERPAARRLVTVRLHNVERVAVNLGRAGLRCGRVRVRSDRPVEVTLRGLPHGARQESLPEGSSVVRIGC